MKVDRKPSAEVQRVIVCHIKQKDLEKQKFKRNKPCKQFRKQKDAEDETKYAIFKYEYVPFKGRGPLDANEPPSKRPKLSDESGTESVGSDDQSQDEEMSEEPDRLA